jgi:hypothetical protein
VVRLPSLGLWAEGHSDGRITAHAGDADVLAMNSADMSMAWTIRSGPSASLSASAG